MGLSRLTFTIPQSTLVHIYLFLTISFHMAFSFSIFQINLQRRHMFLISRSITPKPSVSLGLHTSSHFNRYFLTFSSSCQNILFMKKFILLLGPLGSLKMEIIYKWILHGLEVIKINLPPYEWFLPFHTLNFFHLLFWPAPIIITQSYRINWYS